MQIDEVIRESGDKRKLETFKLTPFVDTLKWFLYGTEIRVQCITSLVLPKMSRI